MISPVSNFYSRPSHLPEPSTVGLNQKRKLPLSTKKDDEISRETVDGGKKRWTAIAHDPRHNVLTGFNRGFWSDLEDKKLTELFQKYGNQWLLISKEMISRNGSQCRKRWVNHLLPDIAKEPATSEEDMIIFQQHDLLLGNWKNIAQKVNEYRKSNLDLKTRRTPEWCTNRWASLWTSIEKANKRDERDSKRKPYRKFNDLEDKKLIELVQKHGNQWLLISKEMISRTGPQCRGRWVNYLHPDIAKEPARSEEDMIIFQQHDLLLGDWRNIAQKVNEYRKSNLDLKTIRTPDWCRNRWFSSSKAKKNYYLQQVPSNPTAEVFTMELAVSSLLTLSTFPRFNRKKKRDALEAAPTPKTHRTSDYFVPETAHQTLFLAPPLVLPTSTLTQASASLRPGLCDESPSSQ